MYGASTEYGYESGRDHTDLRFSNRMRSADRRSERRILRNRLRRQKEMKKNFLLFIVTIGLIVTCSFTLNTFRSNAKSSPVSSYKYYKSIAVANNDTLWSIARNYMDEEHYDSIYDYIEEVKRVNSLAGDSIHYGEYLIIPYYENFVTSQFD